jgi:hypothetical protein
MKERKKRPGSLSDRRTTAHGLLKVAIPLYSYAILKPSIVSNTINPGYPITILDNGPGNLLPR